jgi:recombination protein RecT
MGAAESAMARVNGAKDGGKRIAVPTSFAGYKSKDVKEFLSLFSGQMKDALPKHLTPERLIQVATTMITQNPDIAKCTPQSIVTSLVTMSMLGLEPIPQFGYCYFVPFNNKKTGRKEVQPIIGYRGMLALARNSGQVETCYAECVYSEDHFEYELGLDQKLSHRPAIGEDRGKLIYVYAIMKYKGGGYNMVVMTKGDVEKIRKKAQAGGSKYSPWNSGHYDAMAKKTAIRQLFKYAPVSVEMQTAQVVDGQPVPMDAVQYGQIDVSQMEYVEAEKVEAIEAETITQPETGSSVETESQPEAEAAPKQQPKTEPQQQEQPPGDEHSPGPNDRMASNIEIAQVKHYKGNDADILKILPNDLHSAFKKLRKGESVPRSTWSEIMASLPPSSSK